jgi:hypothetical protein
MGYDQYTPQRKIPLPFMDGFAERRKALVIL